MRRQGSRARFFFAVTVLLIAFGSTSAMAERVPFPIESPENFNSEVFMGTLKDVAGTQGVHRVFFSSGTVGETRLNEVNWESVSIMLGFTVHFKGSGSNQ